MTENIFGREQKEREVEIHVTYRCNLSCPGCDHACFNKRDTMPPDLTERSFTQILDDMDRLEWVKRIHILGGEPTLFPDCIHFIELAASRGFTVIFLSNCYTEKSRKIVKQVTEAGLVKFMEGTAKVDGPRDHSYNPFIFCSPTDLGIKRSRPCRYTFCGISADQNGCTPCPIGSVLAHYQGFSEVLAPLEKMLDADYVDYAMRILCEHCGGYLQLETEIRELDMSKIENIGGTLMTDYWKRIFKCST